jgi:hypothetical protein
VSTGTELIRVAVSSSTWHCVQLTSSALQHRVYSDASGRRVWTSYRVSSSSTSPAHMEGSHGFWEGKWRSLQAHLKPQRNPNVSNQQDWFSYTGSAQAHVYYTFFMFRLIRIIIAEAWGGSNHNLIPSTSEGKDKAIPVHAYIGPEVSSSFGATRIFRKPAYEGSKVVSHMHQMSLPHFCCATSRRVAGSIPSGIAGVLFP